MSERRVRKEGEKERTGLADGSKSEGQVRVRKEGEKEKIKTGRWKMECSLG